MAEQRTPKPAMNPVAREKQMISLAHDLAEKQLRDGSAPPSVVQHFLKLGSTREAKEQEILEHKAVLVHAQADQIDREKKSEQLAQQVIDSMRSYSPTQDDSQLQ